MSNMSYKRQELFTLQEHMDSPPVFGGVRVAHLFFLSVLCFVWLRPVFSVPNAASVFGLSIFDLPFHFL